VVGRHVVVGFRGFLAGERTPDWVEGHDGQRWAVEQVDGYWEHPEARAFGKVPGEYAALTQAWALTVHGPLPGELGGAGRQRVTICSYGTGAGWWMFAGGPGQAPRYQPARDPRQWARGSGG
jgi:hypothetical protein